MLRKLKKVSILFAIIFSLLIIIAVASEIEIESMQFDDTNNNIIISGNIVSKNNKIIFITVQNSQDPQPIQLDSEKADEQGKWKFDFKLPDYSEGRYIISVGGTGVANIPTVEIELLSTNDKNILLNSINSASTSAQLQGILEGNIEKICLDIAIVEKFKSFSDESDRIAALNGMIADSKKQAFKSLVDVQNSFSKNMKPLIGKEKLNIATRDIVLDVLTEYAEDFYINLNGDYSTLTENEKKVVLSGMVGNNFKNISEIKNKFELLVQEQISNRKPLLPPPSGGGGNNSGGGTNIVVDPDYVPIPPVSKPQKDKFTDLNETMWAIEAIEALYEKGLVAGIGDNKFAPNQNIKREEFIKILVNAFAIFDENAKCDFLDVEENSWYYPYIASAQKMGIINGYSDHTIGIHEEISRQDLVTMVDRAVKVLNKTLPRLNQPIDFADKDEIAEYAMESILNLQQAGIINGISDNLFAPNDKASRAMASKIIYELIK